MRVFIGPIPRTLCCIGLSNEGLYRSHTAGVVLHWTVKCGSLSVPYRGRCAALDCQMRVFIIGCKHDQPWSSWAVADVGGQKGRTKTNSVFHGKLTVLLLGKIKRIQKAARANSNYFIRFYTRNKAESHRIHIDYFGFT